MAQRLLNALASLVDAQSGSIMVVRKSKRALHIVAGRNLSAAAYEEPIPIESSVSGLVMYVGKPIILRGRLPREGRERTNVGASLIVPIVHDGVALGVVNLNREPDREPFDDDDQLAAHGLVVDCASDFAVGVRPRFPQQVMLSAIQCLTTTIEARDQYTKGHCDRVKVYSQRIARAMGKDDPFIEELETGASLHDIGKIGIPEAVLLKPDRLSNEEYELMKRHPRVGADIIRPLGLPAVSFDSVLYHHEQFDGTGYPEGRKGTDIPVAARILAVADAYDAMTRERPYRKPFSSDEAMVEIERCKGTQFDPVIVHVVLCHPETLHRASDDTRSRSGTFADGEG